MRGLAAVPIAAALLFICISSVEPQPRVSAPVSTLWTSQDVFDFTLEAAFGDLIEKGRTDEDFTVPGTLRIGDAGGQTLVIENVKVGTRGNTSLRESECEFPKLKVDFSGARAVDTSPFGGMSSVKIGTHCGDGPDGPSGKYGRWPNQKAAHREAFVYRLLDVMGVPTLRARPARITYVRTDGGAPPKPFTRDAMLLEDDDEAMRRFGARSQTPERQFGSAPSMFQMADVARITFGQALIGNFDWCLRMHPRDTYRCNDTTPIWNVTGMIRPDGAAMPVIYDFDLAGIVTGRHIWFDKVFNRSFARSEAEVEVLAQVQRTRSVFARDVLDRTRRELAARKAGAYQALAGSAIDPEGRASARAYMDSFFAAIETDEAFYGPVIVAPTRVFLDRQQTRSACSGNAAVGTPVSAPLETAGGMSRVVLLDALWHWAEKCEAVRINPVWVPTAVISRDFPSS